MLKKSVQIYTDGACRGNPGIGGWGASLQYNGTKKEIYGGELETTNNRMELTAVIEALKLLKEPAELTINSDSKYVLSGINEWLPNWKKRNWKTASRKPVKNVDLWQQLDALAQPHTIKWVWVKGHSGNVGNDRADELANMGIDSL
ncbi:MULTISPECIES: ribonuclease HI [Cycloclasticus]|jgi:ribonuclease HI|uniref:Ribonuclease H n=2 Tax=Cycloclasticus TaxID=34067 RepID=S5TXS0_9GAMM|nr:MULTISPECIES: ribonuclease HI [Cycloclasticus]AFT66993.1 Ribonuclease H [Cycloclasticus sp. P1]AGS39975.1 Ribonuclease HI [Cycloclasticus zancles 78-ME]ATI03407.1 ribonuclease HI [Cycloclasticus sp. PY97N]EPD13880.1 ribonuclease H [Cycloclasticus pugetii]MBV1899539.1 ribonuclease HI [Cycloclasticus sp.]|tara:strand:- start:1470 stop:1907 length:438 start_codon:yes stop_codon:yes gene_type:complete